jgi:hypothetical protein
MRCRSSLPLLMLLISAVFPAGAHARRRSPKPVECPWARGLSHSVSLEKSVLQVDDVEFTDIRWSMRVDQNYESGKDTTWRPAVVAMLNACDASSAVPHYKKWTESKFFITVGAWSAVAVLPIPLLVAGAVSAPRHKRRMLIAIEDSFPAVIAKEQARLQWEEEQRRLREEQERLAMEKAERERRLAAEQRRARSRSRSRSSSAGAADAIVAAVAGLAAGASAMYVLFSDDDLAVAIRTCGTSSAGMLVLATLADESGLSAELALAEVLQPLAESASDGDLRPLVEAALQEALGQALGDGRVAQATAEFSVCLAGELR